MSSEVESIEEELIEFLRELEMMEMRPVHWGTASHKASQKLDELEKRGVIDEGSNRYNEEGERRTHAVRRRERRSP